MTADATFIDDLKTCVLDAVDRIEPEGGLRNDEPWFGRGSRLALDSLDALQLSMAIQKKYGVRMPDSKETRRALTSLETLAEFLLARMPA